MGKWFFRAIYIILLIKAVYFYIKGMLPTTQDLFFILVVLLILATETWFAVEEEKSGDSDGR